MTSIFRPLLAIILLASSFASAASADDAVDAARAWGLIGTWAADCSAPAVKGRGAIISYEVTSDGQLIYRRDHDPSDINEVASARIEPDQTLVLSIVLPKARQTRENGIVRTSDGGIRSLFNRGEDGSYTIREARFVANGRPTPALRKCD
ncbi:hypothetical protein HL667_11360 [Bradyrhizobium sp. 83012]|uniref:Uncharacterized protein n=1 Tax=Bradyrhizobium aeschynomenes TaxID=2734909 RepID=A0ABX2CCQ8_9BRAD|nr:hypothetical protein [Bradyrhizobium aeschynomenes]NPU09977.1 hypothetical protein [Bradyrhizobium aeschynomenes]NPU65593.1 hypothetical protein [Bradyrhizobium aeschynomenes]NPV23463.1 hypothetical protein [Bradyrhizobium aeschynomenes]